MQRHLVGISQIGAERCHRLIALARAIRQASALPRLDKSVALAFFEPSTRTRLSFEAAAARLGCRVAAFSSAGSSIEKGETVADTIRTLEAIGFDAIVLRHRASDAAEHAASIAKHATIVNAGDGCHEHPTQALLDALTLLDEFGSLEGKRIAIIGDIRHSRVYRSDAALLGMLGAIVGVCAPPLLMPSHLPDGIVQLPDAASALEWADAAIVLRLQRERMDSGLVPSLSDYRRRYAVRREYLVGSRVRLLHPGPVNPDIELDAVLVESEHSLIQQQVSNGVFIRMAVMIDIFATELVEHFLSH
jgi:aspartate carbamoyltransferase catalytic subunit